MKCTGPRPGEGVSYRKLGQPSSALRRRGLAARLGLVSRSFPQPEVVEAYERLGLDTFPVGAALKFISLAERRASIYFRHSGPREWDVVAGDLIVRESGGQMALARSGQPLTYNNPSPQVPDFFATAAGFELDRGKLYA